MEGAQVRPRPAGIGAVILVAGALLLLAVPAVVFGDSAAAHAPGMWRDPAASLGTVSQANCPSPRPPVRLSAQAVGDGQVRTTVTAGFGTLFVVLFGRM